MFYLFVHLNADNVNRTVTSLSKKYLALNVICKHWNRNHLRPFSPSKNMNKLQRANHVPKIISRLHLAHYKKWHIINFTSVPVYSQPWGMNLVSYKMKKFWFVTSAYIGLYMVHIHNHWGGGEVIEFQLKQPVMERKITFLRAHISTVGFMF